MVDDSLSILDDDHGIMYFNEKRYAVGLLWLTADEDIDGSLAKKRAKNVAADFYCIRNTISVQHGFGYLKAGHRMGMPAAAAMAADLLVGEWHGVFAADNGWWYLAVHSDAIAPDGDRLFTSEEEAYNYFIERSESYRWPRSYAPAAWNLPDVSGEIPLDKLLDDPIGVNLRPANLDAVFSGKRNKEVIAMMALVFLVVAVMAVSAPKILLSFVPEPARPVTPIVSVPEIIQAPPREPVAGLTGIASPAGVVDTARLPRPSSVIQRCLRVMGEITQPMPGWHLQFGACSTNSASSQWVRVTGSYNSLREGAQKFPEGVSTRYTGSNSFTASKPLGNLAVFNQPVRLLDRDVAINALYERFRDMGQLRLKYVIPKPPPQPEGIDKLKNAPPPMADPPYLDFTLTTKTPPTLISGNFDVPGLDLQSVQWAVQNKTWTYQAEILLKDTRPKPQTSN